MSHGQLLSLLLFSLALPVQAAPFPPVADMTPDMMNQAINANVLVPGGPAFRSKLIADAIALQRMDLIKTCFINPHTEGDTYRAITALPDNELRQKAAIMMMHVPTASIWPKEAIQLFGVPATGMYEPFISTVPSLLPGEVLTKEMVATQAARNQLADRLLAALKAKGATVTETEKTLLTTPPNASSAPSVTPSVAPLVQPTKPAVASTPVLATSPVAKENGATPIFTWAVALALIAAALGLLWWLLKRRK